MTVSPPLNPILCLLDGNGSLQGRDRAGAFTATGSGALRYAPAPGARVNRVLNARFASDTSRWQTNGGVGATHSRVADARFAGGFACRVFAPGDQPYRGLVQSPSGQVLNAPDSSVTQVTISFDIVVESGPISGLQAGINSYTADNAFLATPASANFSVSALNTLERKSLTANANANLYSGSKIVVFIVNGQLADSQFLISNIVLEWGSVSNATYFEPTVWLDPRTGQLGTAYASPSVSRAVFWVEEATTNLIANPVANANTNFVNVTAGQTLSRSTAVGYFGGTGFQVDHDGGNTKRIVSATPTLSLTGLARTFIGSVYARGFGTVYVDLQITYSDATSLAGSISTPVTLTSNWQRLITPTITADPARTIQTMFFSIRLSGAQAAGTYFCTGFQIEEKAYATSYCDGSLGTGYSWSGTAHASASSRVASGVAFPSAARFTSINGSAVLRQNQLVAQSDRLWDFGAYAGVGFGDSLTLITSNVAGTTIQMLAYTGTLSGSVSLAGVTPGTSQALWAKWSATLLSLAINAGAWTNNTRTVTPTGVSMSPAYPNISVGKPGTQTGKELGSVLAGPFITYDQPLSDARRALVNAAIDSNGATDLWTLFEEWEAVGLPLDTVALQAGQATAGVTAQGQAMDLLALQSGQGTAGVKAEGQPIDLLQLQDMTAVGLDGERVIPVPSIREPILAGRS